MFYLKKKNKVAANKPNGLQSCLSGENLFRHNILKQKITDIKNLVSCPLDIYTELYAATLNRLGEYCQAMPFSENEFSGEYGLLIRQLTLAIAALKLRQGVLLPKDAVASTIASEDALWTYAIFPASLLNGLSKLQSDRGISFYKHTGELVKGWSPLTGTLYEKEKYYAMRYTAKNPLVKSDVFLMTLLMRIIPNHAMRWLSTAESIFQQWLEAILAFHAKQNDITAIILQAAQQSNINLLPEEYKPL